MKILQYMKKQLQLQIFYLEIYICASCGTVLRPHNGWRNGYFYYREDLRRNQSLANDCADNCSRECATINATVQPFLSINEGVESKNGCIAIHSGMLCKLPVYCSIWILLVPRHGSDGKLPVVFQN